jgi:2-haloacid dehalogenase
MDDIRALTFDVGGTVFDWQSPIRERIKEMALERGTEIDQKQFALDWRAKMFGILMSVRDGKSPWMNADEMHRRALDHLAEQYAGLALSADDRDDLTKIWHRLNAWPDFPAALERLRRRYRCIVLTVMSFSIVVDSSRVSGILWDGILSCEFLGHYKPDKEVYQKGASLIGLQPAQVMMVAAHPADLRAAKAAGLHTAYVEPKLDEPEFPGFAKASPEEFDVVSKDFTDLADRLCK